MGFANSNGTGRHQRKLFAFILDCFSERNVGYALLQLEPNIHCQCICVCVSFWYRYLHTWCFYALLLAKTCARDGSAIVWSLFLSSILRKKISVSCCSLRLSRQSWSINHKWSMCLRWRWSYLQDHQTWQCWLKSQMTIQQQSESCKAWHLTLWGSAFWMAFPLYEFTSRLQQNRRTALLLR